MSAERSDVDCSYGRFSLPTNKNLSKGYMIENVPWRTLWSRAPSQSCRRVWTFQALSPSYSSNAPSLFTDRPCPYQLCQAATASLHEIKKTLPRSLKEVDVCFANAEFQQHIGCPNLSKIVNTQTFTRVQHASNRHPSQDCGRERMKWERTAPKCSNNCSLQGKSQSTRTTKCSRSSLTSV